MPTQHKLLMVIPINTSKYNDAARAYVSAVLAPDFDLDVVNLTAGFEAIQSRYSLEHNAGHVADLILKIGAQYDGVFISDFDGCGADACREILSVPVVDGFTTQASIAVALGATFSIITPIDTLVGLDLEHPRALGLAARTVSVRPMQISVAELGADFERVIDRATEQSRLAVLDDGAQVIMLGCTAMLGVASKVAERLAHEGIRVPVIDPNLASVAYLQMLVRLHLSQSERCYPTPPELRGGSAMPAAARLRPAAGPGVERPVASPPTPAWLGSRIVPPVPAPRG